MPKNNKSVKIHPAKKIFLYATICLGLLISIEIIFRVVGFTLMEPQRHWNKITPDDWQKVRILALGESTTAEHFSDGKAGGAWPRLLEKKLNAAGLPARVYNEAIGGTTTPFLVGNLPDYINRYHPHFVITMMGINDVQKIQLDESFLSKSKPLMNEFRLVKLLNWISEIIDSKSKCSIHEYKTDMGRFRRIVDRGIELQKRYSAKDVRDILQKETKDETELASALKEISVYLRGDFRDGTDYRTPQEYINLAFDLAPYEYSVAFWKMTSATQEMCNEAAEKLLPCGRNIPDAILSQIVFCARNNKELLNHPVIRSRGIMLAPSSQTSTMHNYKLMLELLNHHSIKLLAMQYPTLSIEPLKQIITQNYLHPENLNGVVLISNEKNFQDALKKYTFEEIFTDRFRGSWGHTTQLGHQIIADNVFLNIQELIRSGCCNDNSR